MKKPAPLLFVLLGSLATSTMAGDVIDIPLPAEKPQYEWSKYALGISYVYQQQDYKLNNANFSLPPGVVLPPNIPLDERAISNIENTAESLVLKFSYTPLPFVSFFAIGGRVDGEVEVGLAPPLPTQKVDYDGWVYGGGVTLSYAYQHYFATLTGIYTHASLDNAEIDTLVVSPKVGIFNEKGALWIGAHYQRTEHSQSGVINLDLGGGAIPISFDVDLEDADNWNYLVGGRWNFTDDLSLTAEIGFADRKQALIYFEKQF